MQNLAEDIRAFCRAHGLRLNTDLGQHFLIDPEVLESILEAANIQQSDHVVEIGPGIGVLTAELLKRTAKVTCIELDDRMIPLLKEYTSNQQGNQSTLRQGSGQANQLHVIQGNALSVPLPTDPYTVVANIPYHITSPLLRHVFLESSVHPRSMTLLIQREVAEKICDEEDRGLLTILVGLFGKPRLVRIVKPEAFLPPPKVDSAVLQIDCYKEPIADTETIDEIFVLVKAAFSQKRKMLRNTLGGFQGGMELLSAVGIDEKRRPQTLSIEEWIALARKRARG